MSDEKKETKQASPGFNLNRQPVPPGGYPTPGVCGPGQLERIMENANGNPMTLGEILQRLPAGQQTPQQPGPRK